MDQDHRIGLASAVASRAVILVEGMSDQMAVQTLAERQGRDLHSEGVAVLPMGGATTIGHFLILLEPKGRDIELAGLCDEGEEGHFRHALEGVGLGADLDRAGMEDLGFFVCVEDLEDELIRALGPSGVEEIIESEGEMASFRRFQAQPAQRDRPIERQLRRLVGTRSGRKIRYGGLMVGALDLDEVPRPLVGVLDRV